VHVHNVKAAALVRAASLGRRVPTLVTLHGVPDAEYVTAARILRRSADRVVAVSAELAERIVAAGLPAHDVCVVENAVQAPTRHPRDDARKRLELDPAIPVAVCLARLVDQKRHDLLIEAWPSVPTDAVLLLAGDGPNRADIVRRIASAGLEDRIRVLGARTDVDWLLAAADVSVLATDWEGLPISILEAMAAGVPVVASAVDGLPGVLGPAADLVVPGSADALGAGITAVLADGAYRDRLVTAGQALVADRFGLDRMVAGYEAEYARLLG
jgi:glycosyltransferase involved in cell wall biosynthesis